MRSGYPCGDLGARPEPRFKAASPDSSSAPVDDAPPTSSAPGAYRGAGRAGASSRSGVMRLMPMAIRLTYPSGRQRRDYQAPVDILLSPHDREPGHISEQSERAAARPGPQASEPASAAGIITAGKQGQGRIAFQRLAARTSPAPLRHRIRQGRGQVVSRHGPGRGRGGQAVQADGLHPAERSRGAARSAAITAMTPRKSRPFRDQVCSSAWRARPSRSRP